MFKKLLMKLIEIYRFFSKFTPKVCRFEPTCSKYTFEAIEKYGAIKGSWMGLKRICRCHPWYKGDFYDPVP